MMKSNTNEPVLIAGQEEWKIWYPYEVFYIDCIKVAALNAIESWECLNKIVSDKHLLETNSIDTVDLAENIVNQAGVISKYFFPPRTNGQKNLIHKLRGEKLRDAFEVDDTNILKDRTFRDFIEHFDEKLDLFLNKVVSGNIIPPKEIYWTSENLREVDYVFKAYVIDEFKLISLNEQIVLPKLMEEIYRVYNQCIEFLPKGRLTNNIENCAKTKSTLP